MKKKEKRQKNLVFYEKSTYILHFCNLCWIGGGTCFYSIESGINQSTALDITFGSGIIQSTALDITFFQKDNYDSLIR